MNKQEDPPIIPGKERNSALPAFRARRLGGGVAILDRVHFPLNDDEFQWFEALFDSPPEPNEALREFLLQHAPWDRER